MASVHTVFPVSETELADLSCNISENVGSHVKQIAEDDEITVAETQSADPEEDFNGNSSAAGSSCNLMNSIVGAGILGLPFALQESGFVLGIILMILVAGLTSLSINIIISCGNKTDKRSYEELVELCYGKPGFYTVSFFMLLFAFGSMCAYLVIIGDTLPVVVSQWFSVQINRNVCIAVFTLFPILPLCSVRDMATLSWSSMVSMAAVVVVVLYVCIASPSTAKQFPEPIEPQVNFANSNVFAGLGAMSFAFVCQHSSFIVYNTLRKRSLSVFRLVNIFSVGNALALCLTMSIVSYLSFFNQTRANILNNFSCSSAGAPRFFLSLMMALTYPMEHFVARQCLFSIAKGYAPELSGEKRMSLTWHICSMVFFIFLTLGVSLTVTDLAAILEITGALSASVLGFILPSLCYFKVHSLQGSLQDVLDAILKRNEQKYATFWMRCMSITKFVALVFLLIFGVMTMVIGTINAWIGALSQRNPTSHICIDF